MMMQGEKSLENRDEAGRFQDGNRFWEVRASHGRPLLYNDPDHLLADCRSYFEWVMENPLLEEKAFIHQGQVVRSDVAKLRAMTIAGLCGFLGITRETWIDWRKNRSDLSEVISRVEAVIWQQKFEGAAAGLLNANLISRDLGLADKQEHSGPDGLPLQPLSDLETARQIAFILAKGLQKQDQLTNQQEV